MKNFKTLSLIAICSSFLFSTVVEANVFSKLGSRNIDDSVVVTEAAKTSLCKSLSRTCTQTNCQSNGVAYFMCSSLCPGKHKNCEKAGLSAHGSGKKSVQLAQALKGNAKAQGLFCDKVGNIMKKHSKAFPFLARTSGLTCPVTPAAKSNFCSKAQEIVKKKPEIFNVIANAYKTNCPE